MTPALVYGDFNCPFCFALDQRLRSMGVQDQTRWVPIEHESDVTSADCSPHHHSMMAREVFTVRHRAPEVEIKLPGMRPNTALANQTFAGLFTRDEAAADAFQSAVFHALWIDGLDISQTEVIEQILAQLGVVPPVAVTDAVLARWQRQWEHGPFDQRIPAMQAADGRVLLGLSSPGDIGAFLEGAESVSVSSGVCEFVPRPVVLVVGNVHGVWPLISHVNNTSDVQMAQDLADAVRSIQDHVPDTVVLSMPAPQSMAALKVLAATESLTSVPLVVLRTGNQRGNELVMLRAGASLVVDMPITPDLFHALLQVHLSSRRQLVRLGRAARIDGLTQIPNRGEFERVASLEWRRGIRSKLPLSILVVDVDHFKAYNDTFGHLRGDGALRHVAAAISDACGRASDTVARYGGEEFVAVLPDTNQEAALQVAEKVRVEVEGLALTHPSGVGAVVTVSVGAATVVPQAGRSLAALVEQADERLLAAKRAGRNRVV